jgi:translation initiation factor 2B subunit (eIF-2B alpha/beta/delta family)
MSEEENTINILTTELAAVEDTVNEYAETITVLKNTLVTKDTEIASKTQTITELSNVIVVKDAEIAQLTANQAETMKNARHYVKERDDLRKAINSHA